MSRRRSRSQAPDAGPEAVVTRLYECYAPDVAAYALRRASGVDAADVVADTFLVAWRRHDEIPGEPATLPWLYGVARRVLANQRRSRERRSRLHDRLRAEFVEHAARDAHVEEDDRFQRVAAALESLSDDDAELLRLIAWEGLTPTDLATAMRLEPAAVRERIHRARGRLRRRLAAAAGPEIEPLAAVGDHGRGSRPVRHRRAATHEVQPSTRGGT